MGLEKTARRTVFTHSQKPKRNKFKDTLELEYDWSSPRDRWVWEMRQEIKQQRDCAGPAGDVKEI